jgi:hypothetical protein
VRTTGGSAVAVEPHRFQAERAQAPDVVQLLDRPCTPGDDDASPLLAELVEPGAEIRVGEAEQLLAGGVVLEVEVHEAVFLGQIVAERALPRAGGADQEQSPSDATAPVRTDESQSVMRTLESHAR